MIFYASAFALLAACVASGFALYRLLAGPGPVDRVLALDTLAINAIALIMMAGIFWGTPMYFEAALLFAMVGFISTVAYCKIILRGDIIE